MSEQLQIALQHTPGPWMYRQPPVGTNTPKAELNDWPFHIDVQGTPGRMNWGILLAKVWGHRREAKANAALLAAAPDLLAACETAIRDAENGKVLTLKNYEAMQAAIKKATVSP